MMPEKFLRDLNNQIKAVKQLTEDIEILAMEEFDMNFDRQGFFEEGGWKPSKRVGQKGGSTLVLNGHLRGDITSKSRPGLVIITTLGAAPYAKAHNEGFEGKVTQEVREHTRTLQKIKTVKGKEHKKSTSVRFVRSKKEIKVEAFSRTLNMKLPKRQFIGSHPYLTKKIEALILKKINME